MSEKPLNSFVALLCSACCLFGQEQVDQADVARKSGAGVSAIALRVRVLRVMPLYQEVQVEWRRGGEGLGGLVVHGRFHSEDGQSNIAVGAWSALMPLTEIGGKSPAWEYPTVVVRPGGLEGTTKDNNRPAAVVADVDVEFEFSEKGRVLKRFTEMSPRGATVGFAIPAGLLTASGQGAPELLARLQGLGGHARSRRDFLEKLFPQPASPPKQFAVIGHLAGYGEGIRYGVRHCNPAIVADECQSLRLLGMNGLVGETSVALAEAAGLTNEFRRIYWGGPGAGSPMNFIRGKGGAEQENCPFDPAYQPFFTQMVHGAIAEHRRAGAKESWGLWWDEIGVAAKQHIADCGRCAGVFRDYVRRQKVELAELGQTSWDAVMPYDIYGNADPTIVRSPADQLRYYYTYRFMTYATAQLFPETCRKLKEAGILLYSMQGPTPSWNGHSLDWNEFYDLDSNAAFVFETSNRDPRTWQWESYLADIGRGIASRHQMPMGALIKPHRGAPEQRMLSLVSRGVRVIEWYTYGPDYVKGDSFSQSPELLKRVAKAGRFLGRSEEFLYGATVASQAEVAFVSPRSSEIWGRATHLGVTAFEDAKWVYLALAHAHIPVDILSEQQLAEGNLGRYKVLYVIGPNLRRDSAGKLQAWVKAGGTLWTDAIGLARDEADQPAKALYEMTGLNRRTLETWGGVELYRAVDLKPLAETNAPASATFTWNKKKLRAFVGREPLETDAGEVLARFSDDKAALVKRQYGKGEVIIAGFWAGLTYSAEVRRSGFDMKKDFDVSLRALISAPAIARNVYRPVTSTEGLVEAVLLQKDGRRVVTLMNWAYQYDDSQMNKGRLQPFEDLRINLGGAGKIKSVRSLMQGSLKMDGQTALLPKLEEMDLLLIE